MKLFKKYHYNLMDFNIFDVFDQLQLFLLMLKFRNLLRLAVPLICFWYVIFDMSYQASSLFGMTRCSGSFYTFLAPDLKSTISLRTPRDHNLGSCSIYFYEVIHCFWAFVVNKTRKCPFLTRKMHYEVILIFSLQI